MNKEEIFKGIEELLNENEKESQKMIEGTPYVIGKNYLIRTVTMNDVGRLKAVYEKELVLECASWVADTGRFNTAINDGLDGISEAEIEKVNGDVIINRDAIVDIFEYNHDLPKSTK